ncbi:MAG: TonB-dependent receptor [Saprospirales bacterium]|nr:TonB-dependent receptor [Saprospirales bacterium]
MKKMILFLSLAAWPAWTLFAQSALSGQITNEKGEPLAGAHVYETHTRKGAQSDVIGLYRIEGLAPGAATLRVTYVGFEKSERALLLTEGENLANFQLTEQPYQFDELLVTATRAGERTPITYKNLGKEELETHNLGQDVPFVLRFTPSLVETSDAGNGVGYTGLRIRGSDPTRINVTVNGIPLNDAESQGVYWVNMPDIMSSVTDVQIQRGVGTSTNGAGAFGASLNLNTNQLRPEPYAQLAGSMGSFNTWRRSVGFGSGLLGERFTIEGRLSGISSDGYIDRASTDLSSYFLSGAWIGKRSALRFNLFSGHEVTYQAWYGVPGTFIEDPEKRTYNPAGTEKEGAPYDNEVDDYSQTHYQLLFSHQLSRNWNLNLNGHYTRGLGFYEQYKADQYLGSYNIEPENGLFSDLIRQLWLDNHFYGLTYALHYLGGDSRLRWTLGGAANRYLGDHYGKVIWARDAGDSEIRHRYYENDAEKRDLNVFSKAEYDLAESLSIYLDLQYRKVFYRFLGLDRDGDDVTQSLSLNFLNPKAGLFWQLSDKTSAYGSFAVGHREPNRNDYTESSPNSRPRPERLYNGELGFQQTWKNLGLNANLYYMHYRDQLVVTGKLNDVGEYTRVNVPTSYRGGVELEGNWQYNGWEVIAGLTLSRNKIKDFIEYVDYYSWIFPDFIAGQTAIERGTVDLAFSPALIGSAQLSYDFLPEKDRSLQFTLMTKYVGKQYLDNASQDDAALDPYFYSDLKLTLSLPFKRIRKAEASVLLANIWNQRYETNGWSYRYIDTFTPPVTETGYYPQAGRNFLLSLKVEL